MARPNLTWTFITMSVLWSFEVIIVIIYLFTLNAKLFDNFFPKVVSYAPASLSMTILVSTVICVVFTLLVIFDLLPRFDRHLLRGDLIVTILSVVTIILHCSLFSTASYKSTCIFVISNFLNSFPNDSKSRWLRLHLRLDEGNQTTKIEKYVSGKTIVCGIVLGILTFPWVVFQSYMLYRLYKALSDCDSKTYCVAVVFEASTSDKA